MIKPQMVVGAGGGDATAGGALDEAELDEVWFVNIFDCGLFFGHGGRDGAEADRSTVKFGDN